MRSNRQKHLQKLKQVKQGKQNRLSQYEVQETQDLIQEIPEEEYKKLQQTQGHPFIVDDFGLGYDDHGELDWQEEEHSDSPQKKPKPDSKQITSFMKPASIKTKKPALSKEESTEMLEEMLNLLDDDSLDSKAILSMPERTQTSTFKAQKGKSRTEALMEASKKVTELYSKPAPVAKVPLPQEPESSKQNLKRKAPGKDPEPLPSKPQFPEPMELEPTEPLPSLTEPQESMEVESPEVDETPGIEFEQLPEYKAEPSDLNPLCKQEIETDSEGNIHFYWIDAVETPSVSPGSVMLFGKVKKGKKFESACVKINEVQRTLYVLPTDEYANNLHAVHQEVEELRKRSNISKMTAKPVQRRYAFELPFVPPKASYLKIQYSSRFPCISSIKGKTIKHVFGAQNSLTELVLVKRKIKGPCWICIKEPKPIEHKVSHCKLEMQVDSDKNLQYTEKESIMIPPPLVGMSISLKCFRNSRGVNEIFAVGGVVNSSIDQVGSSQDFKQNITSFSMIRKLPHLPLPNQEIQIFEKEELLLREFMKKLLVVDPDFLIGHDLQENYLKVLVERLKFFSISSIHNLGRLISKNTKKTYEHSNWANRLLTYGRLLVDTFTISKELLRETTYTLDHLTRRVLNKHRLQLEQEDYEKHYLDSLGIKRLVKHTENDALLTFEIVMSLSVIPLTKQLTNIAGNLWARSLENARAERNEMLLIHEFNKRKFIWPDKTGYLKPETQKKKDQYQGGKVLEPKSGLYDNYVLLLDFNSLYPSIIQEYNICFTTVDRQKTDSESNEPGELSKQAGPGVLPTIIKQLVAWRRETKNELSREQNPSKRKQLDIKQQALKLTANSMYGCLGFRNSRFYARPIASLITKCGRETLEETAKIATLKLNLDVIYGDTDSIMVNSNTKDLSKALNISKSLKQVVNKNYKCLEIELDGIYKSILLLKKKKYAALKEVEGNLIKEVKGLDQVRRDWCQLSKRVSDTVLDIILEGGNKEDSIARIKEFLTETKTQIKEGNQVPLGEFVITKQLTKPPDKYREADNLPHVKVAKKLMEQGKTGLERHFIPYVVCKEEHKSVAERAYHPDEVKNSGGSLLIDTEWYIQQQMLPPIIRLCHPIEEIAPGEIAECLGQDSKKYEQAQKQEYWPNTNSLEHYQIRCPKGHSINTSKMNCEDCHAESGFEVTPEYIVNYFHLQIKKSMQSFYSGKKFCSECRSNSYWVTNKCLSCRKTNLKVMHTSGNYYNLVSTAKNLFSENGPYKGLHKGTKQKKDRDAMFGFLESVDDRNSYKTLDLGKSVLIAETDLSSLI